MPPTIEPEAEMASLKEALAASEEQVKQLKRELAGQSERVAELTKLLAAHQMTPEREVEIQAKVRAGLTREQAVEVVLRQEVQDRAEAEAAKARKK